ncbi:MAG: TetR family transcriptional regulator [Deltaproteobacteria bacterium]|nr:TetR family transcriptional regulator [Deltaproteobacteria bacterium]
MESIKRQPRGERRRTEVLEAVLRVIARDGPRAVTHRAVAQEAGTSVRATTYYFKSKDELLTEAFIYYAARATARFEAIEKAAWREPIRTIDQAAAALAEAVASDLEGDRTGLIAELELVLEIGRNPALEEPYRHWQARLEEMLARSAKALGSQGPERDARVILAALRGLEVEALSRPSRATSRKELSDFFRSLLHALWASNAPGNRAHHKRPQRKR